MSLNLYYCPKLIQIEGLKNLVNLRELRIFKERLYSLQNPDIKPLNFAPLINLEVLILDSYSDRLKGFSKLKSLTQLQLTGCPKLLDYSFLKELTNLNILQIDRLNDKYASQIALLKNLSYLDLKGSAITSIDFLKYLKELVYINFSGCKKIQSLEPLRNHPSLNFLNLDMCSNIRDLTPLSYLPLKELMLMGIPFITVLEENKKVFKTIPTLTHLDLSDQTAVDAERLAHHPALTEVYLRKNKILNQKELLEIPHLKYLTTQETECSEEIIAKLEKNRVTVHKNYGHSKNPLLF
jgi:hypothetical protein